MLGVIAEHPPAPFPAPNQGWMTGKQRRAVRPVRFWAAFRSRDRGAYASEWGSPVSAIVNPDAATCCSACFLTRHSRPILKAGTRLALHQRQRVARLTRK